METSRPIEERGAVYKGVYRFYGCWTNLLLQVLNCLPDGSRSPLLPGVKTSGEEKKLQTDFFLSLTAGAPQTGWTFKKFWELKRLHKIADRR